MADGGGAFDAYLRALAARRAADPDNLAKLSEFRRALRAGCAHGGATLVPVLHAEGHGLEQHMKPHVIWTERNPAASAASLCRRDKHTICLRYMLDFEKITEEGALRFVDAAAFSSPPVTVLDDVATTLGLTWNRKPESMRDSPMSFVDPAMPSPATAADCDLLPMALEVQSLLLSRETYQTRDSLDRIAAAFNSMAPALYEEMALQELGRCLHDRWELDATRARLAEVEQSCQHQRAPQI